MKPPWRNGLACWTSNSKVVGSSPTGGGFFWICQQSAFAFSRLKVDGKKRTIPDFYF